MNTSDDISSARSWRPIDWLFRLSMALALVVLPAQGDDEGAPGTTSPFIESDPNNWVVDVVSPSSGDPAPQRATLQTAPVPPSTGTLGGRVIFTGAGHGWTFNNANGTWHTQRGVTQEMNEDYGNLDQMTMFAAYCIRAGATVVPTRPIGYQTNEVILDNVSPGVSFSGTWQNSSATLFYGNAGAIPYRFAALASTETAFATYTPTLPTSDFYPVYTWVAHGDNRTDQLYRINHTGGQSLVRVPHYMVGHGWVYLGTYYFSAGSNPARGAVIISNLQPTPTRGTVVLADAIRFGNGMGSVVRGGLLSSYPREEECARYWIQTSLGQGQSSTIYDDPSLSDDSDNVGAPIRMAREMNRMSVDSNLFKRVYISFHSNAGGGRGTLGLYNNESLFPGTATPNQFRLAELLGKEVNDDLSAMPGLEVPWNNRGANITFARSDFAFGEIRDDVLGGEMDATIIEVAFHDSVDDAKLLRDPKVRYAAARATYQGVVRYMNQFDSAPLIFLPEPPRDTRAIANSNGVVISWKAPIGSGGSRTPTQYRISRSSDGYGFGAPGTVSAGVLSVTLTNLADNVAHYFRVTALNSGGESLPSETVGCRRNSGLVRSPILVVNGFDRFERLLNPRQTPAPLNYIPPGPAGTMDRVIPRKNNAFDYVVQHGDALSENGVGFDACQNEAIQDGSVVPGNYSAVVWCLGNESTADETFNLSEQSRVSTYLAGGGNLFVSGSEIAWDLDRSSGPTAADRSFLHQQLRAALNGDVNDDAQTQQFSPVPGSIFFGDPAAAFDDGTGPVYFVRYPDVLTPFSPGSSRALQYVGGLSGAAAVQYDGSSGGGKVVYFGFPFETILSPSARETYLADILKFFGLLPTPRFLEVRWNPGLGRVSLTWSSVAGKQYQIQYKQMVTAIGWQNISSPITATDTVTSATDNSPGSAQRFYRVVLLE